MEIMLKILFSNIRIE